MFLSLGFWNDYQEPIKNLLEGNKISNEEIALELKVVSDKILRVVSNTTLPEKVQLRSFLEYLNSEIFESKLNNDVIETLFTFKKVFYGGETGAFTKKEVLTLVTTIPNFFDMLVKFSNIKSESMMESSTLMGYLEIIKELKSLLFSQESFDPALSVDKLFDLFADMTNNPKMKTLASSFKEYKTRMFGGYPEVLSFKDLSGVLGVAEDFVEYLYAMSTSYDFNADLLSSRGPVSSVRFSASSFGNIRKENIPFYKKEFRQFAINSRFFRGKDGLQYYGTKIERNKSGLMELASIKWIMQLTSQYFGHKNEKGKDVLSLKEVENLLLVFKPLMEAYGLWTKKFDNFARNTLLLGDLFQTQSDGDMSLSPTEAAEYGSMALMAIKLGDSFVKELEKSCKSVRNQFDEVAYEVDCYRPHFYRIFFETLGMKEKMTVFYDYFKKSSRVELDEFHHSVEGFARNTSDTSIPMSRRDIILLIGALVNIESTFIRYDTNQNNILDPDEIDSAYHVYENAIIALAKLDESKRHYGKSIFLYMIKYKEKPNTFWLLNFHYNPMVNKKFNAKRINIGVLLYYMVQQAN
jgi:hypothetical protein